MASNFPKFPEREMERGEFVKSSNTGSVSEVKDEVEGGRWKCI